MGWATTDSQVVGFILIFLLYVIIVQAKSLVPKFTTVTSIVNDFEMKIYALMTSVKECATI